AFEILKRIDNTLLQGVTAKGDRIKEALSNCGKVKSICGLGLMLGIEVEGDAKEFVQKAQSKGLLILTAKKKIRLLPALNITYKLLEEGIAILKEILQ
ncbi:MAG: aminotransferase class III-fold pyridoxal phosphate-dependent enzyme, partial [Clostridia bacterium]